MKITSPGIRSEFIFHRFNGEIKDLGDCVAVRTPDNPAFWDGNKLIFANPPEIGDLAGWSARFASVFTDQAIQHVAFNWLPDHRADGVAIAEFTAAGFNLDDILVLTARSVHTDKPAPKGVRYRQISSDADWAAVVDAQVAQGYASIPMAEYRTFKEAQFARYRAMAEQGLGHWWGAFKDAELVADLGLFFDENLGRFQSVETASAHKRTGICRAFICHVSNWAFETRPDITLMLHADEGEVAEGIYRSVGYQVTEVLEGVVRPPNYQESKP